MAFLLMIRQAICRHEWGVTKFQALVPGTSYRCGKCSKIEQRLARSKPTKEGE